MAKAKEIFKPCKIMDLPENEQYSAAMHAISVNPANQVSDRMLMKLGMMPERRAIAVLTGKYHGPSGAHLTVGFMSKASAALQEKIVAYLNKWSFYCNVDFTITGGAWQNASVRIDLSGREYWSFMGTDIFQISRNQPTMRLGGFSLSTPESEFLRVPPHEAGHTLGCPHEHQRPEIIDMLDEQAVIDEFGRTQGWSEQEVRQQILTKMNKSSFKGTPLAEIDSIMCYGFPGKVTKSGRAIPGGAQITKSDGEFMASIYPKPDAPTPPPPPAGTEIITLIFTGPVKPGTYNLSPQDGPPPTP